MNLECFCLCAQVGLLDQEGKEVLSDTVLELDEVRPKSLSRETKHIKLYIIFNIYVLKQYYSPQII